MNPPTFGPPDPRARPTCPLCAGSGEQVDTFGPVSDDVFVTWTWQYRYRPCVCLRENRDATV